MNFDIDPRHHGHRRGRAAFHRARGASAGGPSPGGARQRALLFQADGRFVPEALALRRQARMRSAELGYYNLFGDEKLGGAGQGAQVMAHVQESINHRFGPVGR